MAVSELPVPQHHEGLSRDKVTVHKFGGTSVGGPTQFRQVMSIVRRLVKANSERPVIVVSAMSGITTKLYAAIHAAVEQSEEYKKILADIQATHLTCIRELSGNSLADSETESLAQVVRRDIGEIEKHLKIVQTAKHCPDLISDVILTELPA